MHYDRRWFGLAVLGLALVAALGSSLRNPVSAAHETSSRNVRHQRQASKRFSHIVVIIQENRTVDNMFNGFPGADTVRTGDRFGKTVKLRPIALEPNGFNLDHSHRGFVEDYDNGAMDGFDHLLMNSPDTSYAYVRVSDVRNYWALAKRFTLADEVFQMNMGPSFAAHAYLIAAQGGFPYAFAGNPGRHGGRQPGCFGSEVVQYIDMRTSYPGTSTHGPACLDMPTVFDRLDQSGVAWKYYAPKQGIAARFWTGPYYVQHLAEGPDVNNVIHPETQVLSDVANGTLPPVSYVVPNMCASDHPVAIGVDPQGGPHWVAAITNAIGASQYWDNTLILITWDDWGGWYDHVVPAIRDANSLGFRTPLLIVSAHPVTPGAVDHTERTQASVLRSIEWNFDLQNLDQLDARTDNLSSDFDFNKTVPYGKPLPAATPPAKCKVPSGSLDDAQG